MKIASISNTLFTGSKGLKVELLAVIESGFIFHGVLRLQHLTSLNKSKIYLRLNLLNNFGDPINQEFVLYSLLYSESKNARVSVFSLIWRTFRQQIIDIVSITKT